MELSNLIEISKKVFEISDISELGAAISEKMNDVNTFRKWADLVPDMTIDNLQPIFQYYMADRKEKMQDYTPKSLALAACMIAGVHNAKSVYDMCAGSGALTIQAWNINPECRFICQEFDERVIPFLLFNLALRNINAFVIHGDVLSEEQFKAYSVTAGENFSVVSEVPVPINIKVECCISNPPYNMKFKLPVFAALNERYKYGVPPESNANYAFISAAVQAADNAALILPNGVLNTQLNAEAEIIENLILSNLIDAIVENPDNETLAKALKLPVSEFKQDISPDNQMYEFMEKLSGEKPEKPDYISFTKNKGECVFKANDPEHLSTIFLSVLQMWKQHIMYLNEQENIILAEYRDAILPELMSGKLEV